MRLHKSARKVNKKELPEDLKISLGVVGKIKVSEIMKNIRHTITPDTSLAEAGAMMLENKLISLPVIENDKLVGIITLEDYLKLIV